MGNTDRMIRILIALIIAGLNYAGILTGTLGMVSLVLAVVFLLTSMISFCPLYLPFGISTTGKSSK